MAAPRGRNEAAAGAVAAVLIILFTPGLPIWASYLAFWAPLIVALVVAYRRRTEARGPDRAASIRFHITWMDLLVGAFVGLLLRSAVIALELQSVGHLTSSSSMFVVDHDLIWFASAIVAPALVAPVVEELFFRGLVLPAIGINWIGVIGSAIIFSAMHLVHGFQLLTAVSTFIVGVALGFITIRTGRLGASIVAHVIYNGSLIALSELGSTNLIGG
jgi:membrane protease YdiL (CAAX protease family)